MRKLILAVLGAVIAFFGLFGVQINLQVDPTSIIVSLLLLGVWIFREFRVDWAEFRERVHQTNRWGDPAFWVVAITAVFLPVASVFGVTLADGTVTLIASLLALVVPFVLGLFRKTDD